MTAPDAGARIDDLDDLGAERRHIAMLRRASRRGEIHPLAGPSQGFDLERFRALWRALRERMAELGVPRLSRSYAEPLEWITRRREAGRGDYEVFDHVLRWSGPSPTRRRGLTLDSYLDANRLLEALEPFAKGHGLHLEIRDAARSAYLPGGTTTAIFVEREDST